MPDVNIEYNPKDWGGYLKEYTTETEYNNAIKPLPHAARITGTQEVKFAGGYEPINSEKWIIIDRCHRTFDDTWVYSDMYNCIHDQDHTDYAVRYYLCGKIVINNTVYFLWKWDGNFHYPNFYSAQMSEQSYHYSKDDFVLTFTDDLSKLRPFIDYSENIDNCSMYYCGVSGILEQDKSQSYHSTRNHNHHGFGYIEGEDEIDCYMVYYAGEGQ